MTALTLASVTGQLSELLKGGRCLYEGWVASTTLKSLKETLVNKPAEVLGALDVLNMCLWECVFFLRDFEQRSSKHVPNCQLLSASNIKPYTPS